MLESTEIFQFRKSSKMPFQSMRLIANSYLFTQMIVKINCDFIWEKSHPVGRCYRLQFIFSFRLHVIISSSSHVIILSSKAFFSKSHWTLNLMPCFSIYWQNYTKASATKKSQNKSVFFVAQICYFFRSYFVIDKRRIRFSFILIAFQSIK